RKQVRSMFRSTSTTEATIRMKSPGVLVCALLLGAHAADHADAATILVAQGASTWQYLDAGQAAPPDWNSPAFDASGWRTGAAPLGYGRPGMTTTISYGRAPEGKPITAYFRRKVDVPDLRKVANLVLDLRRDDGAVVYWNGVEILRSNLPA